MAKMKTARDGLLEERIEADRQRREYEAQTKTDLKKAYENLKKAALSKDWWWPEGSR